MVNSGMRVLMTKAGEYLDKAVIARNNFYRGMEDAASKARRERHPNLGADDAKYRWSKSVQAAQLLADNRWHMAQARTWSLVALTKGVYALVAEQHRTNALLEEQNRILKAKK